MKAVHWIIQLDEVTQPLQMILGNLLQTNSIEKRMLSNGVSSKKYSYYGYLMLHNPIEERRTGHFQSGNRQPCNHLVTCQMIVYKLQTAFDIIVAHEKRHLEQAREVMKNQFSV